MNKKKIFYYELRRLFCSREYLLLLGGLLIYCIALIRSTVLFGVRYTAPFSQWTFSSYVSSVSVLLLILLLALCLRQTTTAEQGAMSLIHATSIPVSTFKAIRYSAIGLAYLFAVVLSIGVCLGFYWLVFDYTALSKLIFTGMMLLLPASLFLFGSAMLLGNQSARSVYLLMGIVLIVGIFGIPLPAAFDILGRSVIELLNQGIYDFQFTTAFMAGRLGMTLAGILSIIISLGNSQEIARLEDR